MDGEQAHIPSRMIACRETQALWARKPQGSLIIFVHGFMGSGSGTWVDFPGLAADERLAGSDLVFYDYDSVECSAHANAGLLRDFINSLWSFPENYVPSTVLHDRGASGSGWDSVLLVAHSLGAVVTRRALLDAGRLSACPDWLPRCGFVLFAPAHHGAPPAEVLRATEASIPALLLWSGSILYPVLRDLAPGSPTLLALAKDTETHLHEGRLPDAAIARKVVHASYDRVVAHGNFGKDPPPEFVDYHDHSSVCKPHEFYARPVQFVFEGLPK